MSRSTKKVRSRMRRPQRRRSVCHFLHRGTTGRSKGVMLSHANMVASVVQSLAENHFAETSVYLNTLPTFHLSSMWPFISCAPAGALDRPPRFLTLKLF